MCRCSHNHAGHLPHHHSRRVVLAMLAATTVVAGCKPKKEGPEPIRWGRETCEICGMIISDPRYGAEVRGGPEKRLAKFDDIGDAIHWLDMQDWKQDPDVEFWVMDSNTAEDWLDARTSYYHPDTVSPMDYGFAAVPSAEPGTVRFDEVVKAVMSRGLSSRCLPVEEIASK